MADITLKNLGDLPVVEPDDSTHLLAEQDGAYARVPKDSVGGSGAFVAIIKHRYSDDGENVIYECDKSYTEILNAMTAYQPVHIMQYRDANDPENMSLWNCIRFRRNPGKIYMTFTDGMSMAVLQYNEDGTLEEPEAE